MDYDLESYNYPSTTTSSSKKRSILCKQVPENEVDINRRCFFKGKRATWPGIMITVVCVVVSITIIAVYSVKKNTQTKEREIDQRKDEAALTRIDDGKTNMNFPEDDPTSDQYRNPKSYGKECEAPNFVSRNNGIYIETLNGSIQPYHIKGISWSGMETPDGIPYGLWGNTKNGTTAYEIVDFLDRNNFNSVRIPLCVESILNNIKPNVKFLNVNWNSAIKVDNYIDLLKGIVSALAHRSISVLLDLHTLTTLDDGRLWYSDEIPKDAVFKAIDILTSEFCLDTYWNIIGLDLKNEPYGASWGDGNPKTDFVIGATELGNQMLNGCPRWLAFVEGVNGIGAFQVKNEIFPYYNWFGGGLERAARFPVRLKIPDKVVWSPHYYSSSVYPQKYLYASFFTQNDDGTLPGYVELSDNDLYNRVTASMYSMFGFLGRSSPHAIVVGEFGGLYSSDRHPMKTARRVIDMIIDTIVTPTYTGGYVWALNPESMFAFNPADTFGNFTEGILGDNWLGVNKQYLTALERMDQMTGLRNLKCFSPF